MSEEPTKDLNGRRSFEERVLAAFDALIERQDRFEERQNKFEERQNRFEERQNRFEERQARMEEQLDRHEGEIAAIRQLLETRLFDTRPIWERVLAEIEALKAAVTSLEKRVTSLEFEVKALNKKFRVFNAEILKIFDAQEDLEERIEKLEEERLATQ